MSYYDRQKRECQFEPYPFHRPMEDATYHWCKLCARHIKYYDREDQDFPLARAECEAQRQDEGLVGAAYLERAAGEQP